jgi:ribosome-associated toxin RatA of RatAB toxin-antitoxin module
MQEVRKTVIVARPAAAMFRLVDECERYPEFLPWCSGAEVRREDGVVHARLEIDYHGLKSHVATVNQVVPPGSIDLAFADGPFRHFQGHWRFVPLGEAGCRVEFTLDYAFSSATLERVLGPMFAKIVDTLVDRFVDRAESVPPA